jgi:hypothetical protein
MSIVLPVAMLGATVLGGIGIYVGLIEPDVKGSIKLSSGQRIYVGSEIRLSPDKKDGYPNSCLNKMGNGRVTQIDETKRTVKFVCRKGGRAESEEIIADALDIVSSGINAVGIPIAGGYLIEGSRVRLLQSARAKNRGKGLASPFANAVGVVTHLNPQRRTEVMVRTERLDNSKGSFEEIYQVEDLEFVSGPSEPGKRGIKKGTIGIGSTVQLKLGADGKIDPEVKKKHANTFFSKGSASYRLTGEKHNDAMGIVREWETFGTVTRILTDPKTSHDFATVRCVSKDASKSVVEEDYELDELEAVPARSVPRPGIPIFGGMANNDIKVRLRAERKEAVASKPLGRAAFGDEGTVVDIQPEDKDNLQVLIVCNGKNPEELTKEWYEPEDLEVAEPDDTEGEPVFGGRVTVGSLVRVRQSARGKKCLGTMEVGDIGAVKGIDPNAGENLKINVTCGRSMNAKKSEWYDPRDLELFFATEEAGTPLAQAQSELLEAQRKLNDLKSRQEAPTSKSIQEQEVAEEAVKKAQEKVDILTGQTLDMTKATEVYKNTKEKLESALKLKRDTEELRLKAAKQTTCQQDPERADTYSFKAQQIVNGWNERMEILEPSFDDLKPIQGSENFKSVWRTLSQHFKNLNSITPPNEETRDAFRLVLERRISLNNFIRRPDRTSESNFIGLDDALRDVSEATTRYDQIPTANNPYKSALETIDKDIQKLQEISSDIMSHAYSGDTATEKLLTRIQKLKTDIDGKYGSALTELLLYTADYFRAFKSEAVAQHKYRTLKEKYEASVRKGRENTQQSVIDSETLLRQSIDELQRYLSSKMETVKARKKEAIKSSEVACLLISQETIEQMKNKVEKAVKDKCNILEDAERIMVGIDELITTRQRAFLAARIALDPAMVDDPAKAAFEISLDGDYAGRIDSLTAALTKLQSSPKLPNLQKLVDLCGKYTGDKILDEVKEYIAKHTLGRVGNVVGGGPVEDAEAVNAQARLDAANERLRNVTSQNVGMAEGRAMAAAAEQDRLAAEQRAMDTAAAEEQRAAEQARLKATRLRQRLGQRNQAVSSPRTTRRIGVSTRTALVPEPPAPEPPAPEPPAPEPSAPAPDAAPVQLPDPELSPTPTTPSRLKRGTNFRESVPKPKLTVTPYRPILTLSESAAKVRALGEKLANDQILRLKPRTSGRNVILQLAQDLTTNGDTQVQPILDERVSFQFALSNMNNVDTKVGGAVDVYETEMSKVKTCMATRKASAIEQYDKELEELQKQKRELMNTKTFDVQKQQQQGQQGNNADYLNRMKQKTPEQLNIEIGDLQGRKRLIRPEPGKGLNENQKRRLADIDSKIKLVSNLLNPQNQQQTPTSSTGGQRRRFTVRQPRRFHGY